MIVLSIDNLKWTLNTVINLFVTELRYGSIDWTDAYYSVPIANAFQKYLRFEGKGQLYKYTCYPNGLKSTPRNFTKIAKVPFTELRKRRMQTECNGNRM